MKINYLTCFLTFIYFQIGLAQCASNSNIYSFVYGGKTYEIIRENKTWADAAACAVERGGVLAEINDVAEQNAIFNELNTNAGITISNTVAPDGGNGSYVWLGGNDFATERDWVWDGDNQGGNTPFWSGGPLTGNPVSGRYHNFGNIGGGQTEPDDFGAGQDALAISLNGWPLGSASQWNDVDDTNALYYIIEYSSVLSTKDVELHQKIQLYPNPINDNLTIKTNRIILDKVTIYNFQGQKIKSVRIENNLSENTQLNVSTLSNGIYFVELQSLEGNTIIKRIVK